MLDKIKVDGLLAVQLLLANGYRILVWCPRNSFTIVLASPQAMDASPVVKKR